MTKADIRKEILHYRRLLAPESYATRNQQLLQRLKQSISQGKIGCVHIFLPIDKNKEPDLRPLLSWLWDRNVIVLASKTDFKKKKLTHHPITSETRLVDSDWGIPEPATTEISTLDMVDMILVPLLLFDKKGHRLGYGGGYYDRLLPELPPNCKKVGISLSPGVDAFSLVDSHDIALDRIVTPFETIHCHENG